MPAALPAPGNPFGTAHCLHFFCKTMYMKWRLLYLLVPACLAACTNNTSQQADNKKNTDQPAPPPATARVVPRNTGIDSSNSYSNLFLDSTALEQFIARQKPGDATAAALRNFYNGRNFQYAWFAADGFTEQALAFRALYDYTKDSTTNRKLLDNELDELMTKDSLPIEEPDASIVKTELLLSWRFINYLGNTYKNSDKFDAALQQLVPSRRKPVLQMAEDLLAGKDDITLFDNAGYARLKEQLRQWLPLAKSGNRAALPAGSKKYKKGSRASFIKKLKKRLQWGGMAASADTSAVFDDATEQAVKAFQSSLGLTPNGIVTPALVRELNRSAASRLQQLVVNMERMRWQPHENEGRHILVNIPEFILHAWEGKTKAFDMPIVVGKEGHGTVLFAGSLDQIVFSPYWNVPESIVRREILPEMQKNRHYLSENEMEITGERNGLPVVRQLPGDKNELGKIKFLFPNSFNIYFHDTPHKWLFSRDKRAYSHGCIRLEDARKMAAWLLSNMPGWSPERIDSAMNAGKEKTVKPENPVPVLINYYTAWVDENNLLQFRQDIYRHDEKLAAKLFE